MKGVTMMARMSAADSMPSPSGGPVNSGSCLHESGTFVSSCRTRGTSTNTPHNPYTIEGIAASSSVRKMSGCRRLGGQSSDKYVAMPSEIGAAISNARIDE